MIEISGKRSKNESISDKLRSREVERIGLPILSTSRTSTSNWLANFLYLTTWQLVANVAEKVVLKRRATKVVPRKSCQKSRAKKVV